MLFEKLFYFFQVVLEQRCSLTLEFVFNSGKLASVISSHVDELSLHVYNELVDLVIHTANEVNIGFVFDSYSFLEFTDQLVLVVNDLLTGLDLDLNIFGQLFAVFLLLKLLPVPINLDILFVTDKYLVLEFGSSFSSLFLFEASTCVLQVVVI